MTEVENFDLKGSKKYRGNTDFPIALIAKKGDVSSHVTYLKENKEKIESLLNKSGAIVFRGFSLDKPTDFEKFVDAFEYNHVSYIGGGGPRIIVTGVVMTSTETPPEITIPFHHEMAYLSKHPKKLFFWCDVPAKERGETPIVRSDEVYHKLLETCKEFVEKARSKKIRYERYIQARKEVEGAGEYQKSWEDIFETSDKVEAEKRARETGHDEIVWMEDGTMKVVSKAYDPVQYDERIKDYVWFNTAVLLHPPCYGSVLKKAMWKVTYGDGEEIESRHLLHAYEVMKQCSVSFQWQHGDVMLVDNYIAMHARNSYTPPRRVLAAFAE